MTTTPAATSILDGARLLARHGGIVEVRIPKTEKGTLSGYYNDIGLLAEAVRPWDGRANIYVTLNPVVPALFARAPNLLKEYVRETTGDVDIERRVWLPVDFDPIRPAGTSATSNEVSAARLRRNEVVGFLGELGFPDAVLALSGNGGHGLYAVDLPNDAAMKDLIERALKALHARFSDNVVTVDAKVFNAARVWKLYGSHAVKGDATPERPHRRAVVEALPRPLDLVDVEPLRELAAMAPVRRTVSVPCGSTRSTNEPLGDADLLDLARKARNGAQFSALWEGRVDGYSSHSEADLALANALAFWTGCDSGRIDRLFRMSGLMRPKWDEPHYAGGMTYGQHTIAVAIGGCTDVLSSSPEQFSHGNEHHATRSPKWRLYDAAEDWDVADPEPLIEGLLPSRGVVWWGGLPKRFKSLLLLYICLAIACRRPNIAKHFPIRAWPRMLYVAREDGLARLKARRDNILAPWQLKPEPGVLGFVVRETVDLMNAEDLEALRRICVDEDRRSLILDTWTALSPTADPLGAKDQAQLAAAVVKLAEDIRGLVIVVDHSRKNVPDGHMLSSADIFGPQQKWAAAEHIVMLTVTNGGEKIEVFTEGKDLDGSRFFLTVTPRTDYANEKFAWGGTVEALIEGRKAAGGTNRRIVLDTLQTANEALTVTGIVKAAKAKGMTISKDTVQRHLNSLAQNGQVKHVPKSKPPKYFALRESPESPSAPSASAAAQDGNISC